MANQTAFDAAGKAARVWDAAPAGTMHAKHLTPGSLAFFETAMKRRAEHEAPWLTQAIEFEKTAGKEVLELGCGAGFDAYHFCRHGANYTGIDIAPENPNRTRQHLGFFRYFPKVVRAQIERLPFPDESFAIVYSFGVLHHVTDIKEGLREARRVLKANGQLWILVYHKNSVFYWITLFLVDHLYNRGYRKRCFDERLAQVEYTTIDERPVVNIYTRGELRRILVQSGFVVESVRVRKLVPEDLPDLPLLHRLWPRIPQAWLDRIGMLFGWYQIAKARKS